MKIQSTITHTHTHAFNSFEFIDTHTHTQRKREVGGGWKTSRVSWAESRRLHSTNSVPEPVWKRTLGWTLLPTHTHTYVTFPFRFLPPPFFFFFYHYPTTIVYSVVIVRIRRTWLSRFYKERTVCAAPTGYIPREKKKKSLPRSSLWVVCSLGHCFHCELSAGCNQVCSIREPLPDLILFFFGCAVCFFLN